MAVQRTSQPLQQQAYRAPTLQSQSSVSNVNPDFAKYQEGESTSDRIVNSLLKNAAPLAEKAFNNDLEEQYLKGVEQAATVRSEDELETNPLTSDWTKAGYRDTQGRIAMAQQQADIATDMPELVKGTPEQFAEYMAAKRRPLVDQLNGMSKQQRAAQFGQIALDQAAATKRYTSGRTAYIQQQEQASIQQSMTARRMNMDSAKGDLDLYNTEVNGFVSSIYKDVWSNPKLTDAMKVDMTRQAAEFAASSDNVAVHNAMQNTKFQFADGSTGTLLQKLPWEDQIKVDKAQRQAMDRVKVTRSGSFETWVAASEAAWSDPNVGPTESYEEVAGRLDQAEDAGILSVGKRESVLQNYFKAAARNSSNGLAAQAYAVGDIATLNQMGLTQEQGLAAWSKSTKDIPIDRKLSQLLAMGNNTGQDSALTEAGNILKAPLARLGYGDDINPDSANLVLQATEALNIAYTNNPGAYSKFMQALPSDQQDMFVYLREAQQSGMTEPLTAVKYARSQMLQDKQTGGVRQARVAAASKEDAAAVLEIDDRQLFGTISSTAKAFIWGDEATKKRLGTGRSWFESADRTAEVRASSQLAYAEELALVAKTNPFMSASGRQQKALASLGNRIVDTESGPLIMPKGQSLSSYFGVPTYADQAYVGKAINELYKPAEGNRIAWTTTADNMLIFRELNGDNKIVRSGQVDPKQVAPKVAENLDADARKAAAVMGPGVVVQGKDGSRVQFNGANTAGVREDQMLQLRQDIVQSEGVTKTKYADSGGQSFGVGIHQSNTHYQAPGPTGEYNQGQINESFLKASDDAAKIAQRSMSNAGVKGDAYMRLFGEMAYQSPNSARDPELLAHIQLGDKSGAMSALKATPAYKNSTPERQASYVRKLEQAMR